jgi:DNA processing protein
MSVSRHTAAAGAGRAHELLAPRSGACSECLRRSWLLSAVSGVLDRCARDRTRLLELLALCDEELIAAVAGRRADELRAAYESFEVDVVAGAPRRVLAICRHARGYPRALTEPAAPHMLTVLGGCDRLARLTAAPAVAIIGSSSPSDYGRETARGLARGLAASGVTVVASLADGVASAALAGVLAAHAGAVAVLGDGLGVVCSPRLRPLYERVTRDGCAISELPHDCAGRRWGQLASARTVVGLGLVSVVVEARETSEELAAASAAKALGRVVAAIPGRVSSPLSRGAHALLMDGASLVRGPRDVLELIYACGEQTREQTTETDATRPGIAHRVNNAQARGGTRPMLREVLERVGAGYDTPDKLTRSGVDAREVLPALSELELEGLLVRGDGGRYLPRDPLD